MIWSKRTLNSRPTVFSNVPQTKIKFFLFFCSAAPSAPSLLLASLLPFHIYPSGQIREFPQKCYIHTQNAHRISISIRSDRHGKYLKVLVICFDNTLENQPMISSYFFRVERFVPRQTGDGKNILTTEPLACIAKILVFS